MASKILRGVLSVIGGEAAILLVAIITTPIITRILGSGGYGDYAFILSMLSIITIFTRMGISAGIRKYIVEDRNEKQWRERVFGFYFQLGMALAIVSSAAVAVFSFSGLAGQYFGEEFRVYFYLLCGIVLAEQFIYVFRYTLMGLGYEHYSEPLIVGKRVLFAVVGISLAYVGYGVTGLLAGTIIAAAIASVAAFFLLREKISMSTAFRSIPPKVPYRELIGFNISNTIFVLLTISLYHTDILLLQPFVGSEQTGFYKAALVIAEFLWFAPIAIQTVFIHSTSEMWSKNQYERITRIASQTTRYTLGLSVLLALGLASLSDPFVPLYFGTEFEATIVPLLLLLPGALGFAVARPIFAIGQAKGDLRILIYATGTAAVINLVLNLLLIPRYGMNGAAVATSIGYGSMIVFHIWSARKIGFDPIADLRLSRIAVTAGFSAPVIFGLAHLLTHDILSLIVVPPIGFVVYSTFALKTRAIDPEELHDLLARLPTDRLTPWL